MNRGTTPERVAGDSWDVLIAGGGLAGLCLAVQLRQARPGTRIVVLEKRAHPVPEAAFKVGESTVQIAARYFERLGMEEHLRREQLPKLGMRFFLSCDGNRDITERVEVGQSRFAPLRTYQLDRGRLENALAQRARDLGVAFRDNVRVARVELDPRGGHRVEYVDPDGRATLSARWVVDASGRPGILKRRLGLVEAVEHDPNAAWFRIHARLAIDDWSDDPAWQARVPGRQRWLSTVHLTGPGYWVWLIPLASGATSVGIVADPEHVPFERIRRFDAAVEWLDEHEPQLAEQVRRHSDELQDFRTLKHYAHGCDRVFSADRWGLTGEAGVFLDPLYSPGSDFIAVANDCLTRAIHDDLDGAPGAADRIESYDQLYRMFFRLALGIFERQYPLLGHSQVTAAKTLWDTVGYLRVPAVIGYYDRFTDLDFMQAAVGDLGRFGALNARVQAALRAWAALDDPETGAVGWLGIEERAYLDAQHSLTVPRDSAGVHALLSSNVAWLELMATELFAHLTRAFGGVLDGDPDPYAFELDAVVPAGATARAVEPRRSRCGLLWATPHDPDGATTEGWSVWHPVTAAVAA